MLVAGGRHKRSSTGFALATAEVFDPETGHWHPAGSMSRGRHFHTATLLSDRQVLVVGAGTKEARFDLGVTAERYDPLTGLWSPTSPMRAGRGSHSATLLPDGRVLVAGGNAPYAGPFRFEGFEGPLASAEIYDPIRDEWLAVASMSRPRASFTATVVGNGVLVVGAPEASGWTAEQFNLTMGEWSNVDGFLGPQESAMSVALLDGSILIAGGVSAGVPLRSTELYVPPS